MASKTTNYGLNKHSPQDFYNVEARNENWDKIDEALAATDPTKITAKAEPADGDGVMIADSEAAGGMKRLSWEKVKAALGKLFVPLARKINGKTLEKDVTLTGDDIAMGADDSETLRAAMAKRDVEYGVIEPENLQEWASAQTAGGTFMLTPSTTKGVPETRYWRGVLSVGFPGNDRALLIFTSGEMYLANTSAGQWTEPWRKVADCIAPGVHDLPLSADCVSVGACYYYRTQESICHVRFNVQHSSDAIPSNFLVGTLPEGFRPKEKIWVVGAGLTGSVANAFANAHVYQNGAIIIDGFSTNIREVYFNFYFVAA